MDCLGEPTDVANMVGFLMSDDAKWVTGQVRSPPLFNIIIIINNETIRR